MIRIEVEHQRDRMIIKVEGRLVGMFVPELERCWREQSMGRAHPVVIDLKSVLSIDEDGRQLLRAMYNSGVTFRGAGMSIEDELEAITQPEET